MRERGCWLGALDEALDATIVGTRVLDPAWHRPAPTPPTITPVKKEPHDDEMTKTEDDRLHEESIKMAHGRRPSRHHEEEVDRHTPFTLFPGSMQDPVAG
eukprot:3096854-Pyramimonas_sp.AAC.2